MGVFSESGAYGISENTAGMIGLIVLLVLVTIAVAIFIFSGSKTAKYEYLEEEVFETEYGVTGMVKERKEKFQAVYTKYNIVGVSLCILALVPFFTGAMFCESNEIILVFLLCLALVIIGIAVVLFVRVGIIHESFEKLLQEGDYTKAKKRKKSDRQSCYDCLLDGRHRCLSCCFSSFTQLAGRLDHLGHCRRIVPGVDCDHSPV